MRRGIVIAPLAAFVLALLPGAAFAGGAVDRLMKAADALYAKRAEKGAPDKAIEAYQQVLAVDDANAEAYWKIARTYYWKGTHAPSDAKAMDFHREGIEFAKLGVAVDPKSVGAHFWLACEYGSFGEVKGILQSLHLIEPTKKELEIALKLDPSFEWGGSQRVLSRFYWKVPGYKGGDTKKAVEFGRKAVEVGPEHVMNHLFLAEALIADGQKEEAKKILEHIATMKPLAAVEPENVADKARAKELLESL